MTDRERNLIAALREVKRILTVPAAEYVPAIPDAWAVIDSALSPTPNKDTADG